MHTNGLWRCPPVVVWILGNWVWHRMWSWCYCCLELLLMLISILFVRCNSKDLINWHARYLLSRQFLRRTLLERCKLVDLLELSFRRTHVLQSYVYRWDSISFLHRPCRISARERIGILCMIEEGSAMTLRELLVMILDTIVISVV